MSSTVLTSWALLIWNQLQARGCDARQVFRRAGLNPAKLGDGNARYSQSKMQKLWALVIEATGDPDFSVEVGKSWAPTTFHALGFAWLASSTLEEALQRFARYSQIISTGNRIEFSRQGAVAELAVIDPSHVVLHKAGWSATFSAVVCMCRMLLGPTYSPYEIHFQGPRSEVAPALEAFVQCPVRYGMDKHAVLFDNADLYRVLPGGNSQLLKVNEDLLLDTLSRIDKSSIVILVTKVIKDRLPSGGVDEQIVAQSLNMSVRSLQRKLGKEGTRYRALYASIRSDLADVYLRDRQLSLVEISYLLGFSEQASFSRAFRRWFGQAPSHYRVEVLAKIA